MNVKNMFILIAAEQSAVQDIERQTHIMTVCIPGMFCFVFCVISVFISAVKTGHRSTDLPSFSRTTSSSPSSHRKPEKTGRHYSCNELPHKVVVCINDTCYH